jgi:hypothetical protein
MTSHDRNVLIAVAFIVLGGLALYIAPVFSSARIDWPVIANYDLLVSDCVKLSRENYSGPVSSVDWPESIRSLNPRFVSLQVGLVVIVLSTGGIDAGWGLLVYTDPCPSLKDIRGPHLHPTTHHRVYRLSNIE